MASKTQEKRAALRENLIDIADRMIAADGIHAIKARTLATEAGCAVGAIYNVFGDLNDLIFAVNMRTFAQLGNDVGEKGQDPALSPREALVTLAIAYLEFAVEHPKKWRALFDVELPADADVPEWYITELRRLFQYIAAPLSKVMPELGPEDLQLMTRSMFSSVHGIVLLGLENRISGVPKEKLDTMIRMIIERITK